MIRPELKDSKITIVMPLLNEVAVIEQLVNQTATVLNQTGCQWQFILVNDGSTDGSREVLDHMADAENRIVVPFSKPQLYLVGVYKINNIPNNITVDSFEPLNFQQT